jgi:hypothetical protein
VKFVPVRSIVTDDWLGYNGIEKAGFNREIYNQSKADGDDELLPHVHLIISLLKRWFLGIHQGAVAKKHLCRHILTSMYFDSTAVLHQNANCYFIDYSKMR